MKIGPFSMMIILTGIGSSLVKQNLDSIKKRMLKKIENKLKERSQFKNIDF